MQSHGAKAIIDLMLFDVKKRTKNKQCPVTNEFPSLLVLQLEV